MFLVNNMELKYDKTQNFQERLRFLRQYTSWVKSVPNDIWSSKQAQFINSLYANGENFSLSQKQYLHMVDAGRAVRNKRLNQKRI